MNAQEAAGQILENLKSSGIISEMIKVSAVEAVKAQQMHEWVSCCPVGQYFAAKKARKIQAEKDAKIAAKKAIEDHKNARFNASEDERLENILDVLLDIAEDKGRIRMTEIGRLLTADGINNSENIAFLRDSIKGEGIQVIAG